jgi:hypothetical protein
LIRHYLLGASTGYMAAHRGDWPRLNAEALELSPVAIELAALSEDELPGLLDYFATGPELPYRYLSVHAPSKAISRPEPELVEMLTQLPRWLDAIVVHPDVIDDPANYRPLGARLLIENMDDRKGDGRTAAELAPYFEALPEAGLCFDIAHAASIDPSMDEGRRSLDAFAGRLREVHLSSLDADSHHVPLRESDEERFSDLLARCKDVPWILEAPPPDA